MEQSEQARAVILPLLRAIPAPVCYIMGNDDHVDLNLDDTKIPPVHGRRLAFGAWSVYGYQYSPPFMGGCHDKPEEQVFAADLVQIEAILDETTVLVTHSLCQPKWGTPGVPP